jgi:hypothetical protein
MHITTDAPKGMGLLSFGTFRLFLVYCKGVVLISDCCPVCGVFISELLLAILAYSSLCMFLDFLTDPIFDMNHMRNVSAATEKLCEWVMAIEEYDRMVKGSGGTVEESK